VRELKEIGISDVGRTWWVSETCWFDNLSKLIKVLLLEGVEIEKFFIVFSTENLNDELVMDRFLSRGLTEIESNV
jgi:hypothetical protein